MFQLTSIIITYKMVYLPADAHPSKYKDRPMNNFYKI